LAAVLGEGALHFNLLWKLPLESVQSVEERIGGLGLPLEPVLLTDAPVQDELEDPLRSFGKKERKRKRRSSKGHQALACTWKIDRKAAVTASELPAAATRALLACMWEQVFGAAAPTRQEDDKGASRSREHAY